MKSGKANKIFSLKIKKIYFLLNFCYLICQNPIVNLLKVYSVICSNFNVIDYEHIALITLTLIN